MNLCCPKLMIAVGMLRDNTLPPLSPVVKPLRVIPTASVEINELTLHLTVIMPLTSPAPAEANSIAGIMTPVLKPTLDIHAPSIMQKPSKYPSDKSNSFTIKTKSAPMDIHPVVTCTINTLLRFRPVKKEVVFKEKSSTNSPSRMTSA